MGRRDQRVRAVPRRSHHGKLRLNPADSARGAGHSAGHAVRVPDPARRLFGIWGLALVLPLMAIVKVMVDYFKGADLSPDAAEG